MRPGGVAQGGVGVVERFDAGRVRGEEGDESCWEWRQLVNLPRNQVSEQGGIERSGSGFRSRWDGIEERKEKQIEPKTRNAERERERDCVCVWVWVCGDVMYRG